LKTWRAAGEPRRIWEDNIKEDLREYDEGVDWLNLTEDEDM
jgi:hypothetical protein